MNKIESSQMQLITGGTSTVSSTVINAICSLVKVIMEVGENVGSGIRRVHEGALCPLE